MIETMAGGVAAFDYNNDGKVGILFTNGAAIPSLFAADLWSTPIWWRRARFSSCRAARERKIEVRVARSDVRRISIAENYEGRISLIRSDISRFSGGIICN
jgi:hypothetical protein